MRPSPRTLRPVTATSPTRSRQPRVRRRRAAAGVLASLLVLTAARGVRAADPVRVRTLVRAGPPQHLYVARVDLSDPRVGVAVVPAGPDPDGPGPWETTLQLPSVVARDRAFDVAVNGGFFMNAAAGGPGGWSKYAAGDPAQAAQLVISDGRVISHQRDGVVLSVGPDGRVAITAAAAVPPDTRQAVGGSWLLVDEGKNLAPDDARHARTAAGLTADGRTLVLLVADGGRPGWAAGLTLKELADAMVAEGCRRAVNLDGGGSSTMVRRDTAGRVRVVNAPSDGAGFVVPLSVQRPVAYVLGVRVAAGR